MALYIKRLSEVQKDSVALRQTDGVVALGHGRVWVRVSRTGQNTREIRPNLALTRHCTRSVVVMEKVTLPASAVIPSDVVVAEMIAYWLSIQLQEALIDIFCSIISLKSSESVFIGEVTFEDH